MHGCRYHAAASGVNAVCGSDFDELGNQRFIESAIPYGSVDRTLMAVYNEDMQFGYTSYDNIFVAFVTTFQSCSMEGWTTVMYHTMDAWSVVPSVLIFVVLVLIGGNIVLNLVLAVVTSSLDKLEEDEEEEEEEEQQPAGEEKAEEVEVHTGLKGFVKNPVFGNFIMICILLNTIILAMDHDGIEENEGLVNGLDMINVILTFVFLAEMILNIAGLGPKEYFSDAFSCFDATIVVISMIDFAMSSSKSEEDEGGGGGGAISALRGARLLRILKMAKEWETMQTLLGLIAKTVLEIGNFGILLFLFIFIYSLCGMQFFANRMRFDDNGWKIDISDYEAWENAPDHPQHHFDDIAWAMVTVFQILTGEDWNAAMYDGVRSAKIPELAIIFYLSLVIFGAFIVMNLFLAILLGNFEGNDDIVQNKEEARFTEFSNETTIEDLAIAKDLGKKWKRKVSANHEEIEKDAAPKPEKESTPEGLDAIPDATEEIPMTEEELKKYNYEKSVSCFIFAHTNPIREMCRQLSSHKLFDSFILGCILISSFCLALDNPLNDPDGGLANALIAIDLVFSIIFMVELVTKVISLGFILHPGSYLRDPWNMLDSAIVLISILSLSGAVDGGSLKALRTFRVLRPLRMIKRFPELKLVVDALVSSVPGALNVMVISCLFLLLFAILGVSFYKGKFNMCDIELEEQPLQDFLNQYPLADGTWNETLLTWDNFDSATGGRYSNVFDSTLRNNAACDLVKSPPKNIYGPNDMTSKLICDCLDPDAWGLVTDGQTFDDVIQAFSTLFEITTTEGWTAVTYAAVDNMGKHMQPKRDAGKSHIIFFVLFMLVGAFFVMELFVGVVIDNFNRLKETKGGNIFMTESQEEWAKTQAFIMKIKPEKKIHPPTSGFGALWCYNFVMPNLNPKFDQSIMACIIGNSVVMAMQHHGQSEVFSNFIEGMNYLFAFIFSVEAILKLNAMGWKYFRDSWNKFDFIVVLGTNIGILIKLLTGGGVGAVASIVRMFRIGRLVRLINSAKSIRMLFNTLITSIPSMANIGFLLFILFFIFSVMGVQSYAMVMEGDNLSTHANFRTIGESFILLFRFATGENWNGYMHTMLSTTDGCTPVKDMKYNATQPWCITEADYMLPHGCTEINGCGDSLSIPPHLFFYMFTLMVTFVMLNLFVGVVLGAFENSEEGDILGPEDLDKFIEVWGQFDPEATFLIKVNDLKQFVDDLDKPMGFGKEYQAKEEEVMQRMRETGMWEIPYVQGEGGEPMVHITHVATAMAKRLVQEKQGEDFKDLDDNHPNMVNLNTRMLSSVRNIKVIDKACIGDLFLAEADKKLKEMRLIKALTPAGTFNVDKSPVATSKKPVVEAPADGGEVKVENEEEKKEEEKKEEKKEEADEAV